MTEASRPAWLRELLAVLAPLRAMTLSEDALRTATRAIGWDLEAAGLDLHATVGDLGGLGDGFDRLMRFGGEPPHGLAGYVELLSAAREVFDGVRGIGSVLGAAGSFDELGGDLLDSLVIAAWSRFFPVSFAVGNLLTLFRLEAPAAEIRDGARVIRRGRPRAKLAFDRIGPLLRDPIALLRDAYFGAAALHDRTAALAAADRLFPPLVYLARQIGLGAIYGLPPDHHLAGDPRAIEDLAHTLTMFGSNGDLQFGAAFALSGEPATRGLVVRPFGEIAHGVTLGEWKLTVAAEASVSGLLIGDGVRLAGGDALRIALRAERLDAGVLPPSALGGATGSAIELGAARVEGQLAISTSERDAAVTVTVDKLRIRLAASDGDGFVARLLPSDGLSAELAVSLGWSSQRGFHFGGSASLAAEWPLRIPLGPIRIDRFAIELRADAGVAVAATVGLGLALGPLEVAVEQLGIAAAFAAPPAGGNLGPLDLDLRFKPPSGVALALELGAVRGAGRLRFEPGRYLGGFHLDVARRFAIDLVALLETRNPGFSLVIAGVATFPATPLGFGFELRRAGALIAIHRRLDLDALQAALQAGRIAGLLAVDPARPEQLGALGAILPYRDGSYVAGLVLGVTWGHPVLATIDLTFLYDTAAADRLVVIGTLTSALPAEHPLLRLNVDVLGVFEASPLSIDVRARLRDSSLAGMKLSGDAALQLRLGDQPRFVLSLGGFHSGFTPPSDFPVLRRLELSLPPNDVVQLSLRAFFAVTASSLQFGADAHFWAGIDGVLGVEGDLQFEALVALRPLHFEAALDVHIAVRVAGHTLFGADLRGALAGPGPWHVTGGVFITVMWWEVEVYSVDAVFGAAAVAPALPPVDLAGEVIAALRSPRAWRSRPRADQQAVIFAGAAGDAGPPVLHPSAPLEVSQTVAPLGVALDHAGGAGITGARTIAITAPQIAGRAATTVPVLEPFAVEQFFALSDADKLSRPAFEDLTSGVRFDAAAAAVDPATFAVPAALGFETIPAAPETRGISDALVDAAIAVNAVDVAGWHAPPRPVTVRSVQFVLASTETLATDAGPGTVVAFASRIEAARALADLRAADPARAAALQVVPR